jgi:acetyl-CoA acetyltransferase
MNRRQKMEDPERMRALAAEYRAIAENTRDRVCRQQLLAVARSYDKIAAEIERVRPSAAAS